MCLTNVTWEADKPFLCKYSTHLPKLGNTIVFSKLSPDVNLTGLDKLLRDLFLFYLTLSFSSIKAKSKPDISLTLAVNTGSLEKRYLSK